MAHPNTRTKQRPRKNSRKKPQRGWKAFLRTLYDAMAFPALIFGVIIGAMTAVNLPQDVPALQQDTYLRQEGTSVPGTVAMVDQEHHDTKHGSYEVFTPLVTYSLRGTTTTTELDRYAVIDKPNLYRKGHPVTVMIAPTVHDESDIGIRSDTARAELERGVRNDIILATIGAIALIYGAEYFIVIWVRSIRRKRGQRA